VNGVHDLGNRILNDRPVALPAESHGGAGEKYAEKIVDFGDGGHGGSRAGQRGALLDGDGGAEAVDAIDVGRRQLLEELAGVNGKRFDVAATAFGVNGVEGEGAFSGAGQAGDDGQFSAGDADGDVFEIVLPGPGDVNEA
jgi:hypothetical protein